MRVALLSLMEAVPGEGGELRGLLPIGGRSIVRHQLGLALGLGCTRILVLAENLTGELVTMQHLAEARGARFHVVASARAIVPLVAPEDDLFVLADGLLAMPDDVLPLLEAAPVVLTTPVETGIEAGFERIDINNAGAGAMRLPGRLVASLGELPPEWNPLSALLRIAGQARVPQRVLPEALFAQARWQMVRTEGEAHQAEHVWLGFHAGAAEARSPGAWVASVAVRRFGPALLHAGTRPAIVGAASAIMALLGVGAGWMGWATIGFAVLALAWVVLRASSLLARIERASLLEQAIGIPVAGILAGVIDLGFVAVAAWRSHIPQVEGVPWGLGWFAPLVLFLLLRLFPEVLKGHRWVEWLPDRLVVGAALAWFSGLLPFDLAVRLTILALLAAAFFRPRSTGAIY